MDRYDPPAGTSWGVRVGDQVTVHLLAGTTFTGLIVDVRGQFLLLTLPDRSLTRISTAAIAAISGLDVEHRHQPITRPTSPMLAETCQD